MLYLIGLGLNVKGISIEGKEAIKKCKKVYLESYTVDFPYELKDLSKSLGKRIVALGRTDIESDRLVKESKKEDIALLIYGCPLFATTHMSLIIDLKKAKVKYSIIYSASVFDAIAESGLQLYKFGKISSMPKWQKNFEPDSFLDFVIQNRSIGAHSLILIDISLGIVDALNELQKSMDKRNIEIDKLIVTSNLGNKKKFIFYGTIDEIVNNSKKIKSPYCFIIPGEMHFFEKEILESYS